MESVVQIILTQEIIHTLKQKRKVRVYENEN